jgi:hypothetical protein
VTRGFAARTDPYTLADTLFRGVLAAGSGRAEEER